MDSTVRLTDDEREMLIGMIRKAQSQLADEIHDAAQSSDTGELASIRETQVKLRDLKYKLQNPA